ncbi:MULTISPECIES: ABC antibiotics transporter [unclassified Nocardioides]|uniref:ABC transporter permease n=1 Tax=unclassified Nocardioides TaxID=2615069 RepID=UPI0000EB619A|nr:MULTISPECIES: ABC antibiotics transporter [unclassified Nocardioides]ABL81179.1 putative ABC antibiotics transporter [Nocardioides sp. JS614]
MSTVSAPAPVDLAGTRRLVRLAVRRDRYTIPAWWAGLGLFVAATTAMFTEDLARQEDLLTETELVATNAGMRLIGLTSGPSVGGYLLHREFVTLAVLAAVMSTFAVIRHTRQNEELGRAEMLGSTVVGRQAGLAAGVLVALAADLGLALVLGAAIAVNGLSVEGAFLAGASVAAVGIVWVGLAAVTCQLSATTRGAAGIAMGALGVAFVLSGVGNMIGTVDEAGLRVASAWPAWLSPIGWGQQTRPFADALWWPLLLALAFAGLLLVVAVALGSRRDVGRGLWAQRRGPGHARRTLLSPTGLVWRLQRGVFLAWGVALTVFGLIFGSLTEQIQGLEGDAKEWWTEMGGTAEVVAAYQVSMIQMAGMFVAMYAVQALLRMRVDELGGTLEPLLAAGVTRIRWWWAHLVTVVGGSAALMVGFAAGMGLATGQVVGDTGVQVRDLLWAGLVQLPGVVVVAAAVVAIVCLVPRWSVPASWALLLAALVAGPMFGPGLKLPTWVQDLSPFTHSPQAPAVPVDAVPLLALGGAAVALAGAALLVLRRRDLALPA